MTYRSGRYRPGQPGRRPERPRAGPPQRRQDASQKAEEPRLLPLPQETRRLFDAAYQRQKQSLNLSLVHQRYIRWLQGWSLEQKHQHDLLRALTEQARANAVLRRGLSCYRARQEAMVKSLANCGYATQGFTATSHWRLAIGLATGGVLEAGGLVLHRLYGFPYIPGSSLKGLALAWGRRLRDDGSMPDERLKEIFGTADAEGRTVFFDALPAQVPSLDVDIMNPHYKDYYEGNKPQPPADYLSPSPVFFLTVAAGTPFRFAVAVQPKASEAPTVAQKLLDDAVRCLQGGLEQLGAGAKTSAGYGYFVT